MDKLNHLKVEVIVRVCPTGYRLISSEPTSGGIAALGNQGTRNIQMVVPNAPGKVQEKTVEKLSEIWRDLVHLDNLRRVAHELTLHNAILKFCGKYGVPCLHRTGKVPWKSGAPVAEITYEAKKMVDAIQSSRGGYIEAPADVMSAFQADATFRINSIAGDMHVRMDNILLAAWFDLVNTRVLPKRICKYCRGINTARAKAQFCSDYCRDRWHKLKMRSR